MKSYANGSAILGLMLLSFCWRCSYQGSKTQKEESAIEIAGALKPWDEPPQPVGGYREIQKNLFYPEFARKDGVEGRVVIEAAFNDEGGIKDMKIIESLGADCDQEAIRAIQSVRWKPAKQKGVPVEALIAIPVKFTLRKMHPEN